MEDDEITVERFYHNNDMRPLPYHQRSALLEETAENPNWSVLKSGDVMDLGNVRLEVLWPPSNDPELLAANKVNCNSIVAKLIFGDVSFLLTGDCNKYMCEPSLIEQEGSNLKSTILKAGHNGGETSSTPEFLKTVGPELIVIIAESGGEHPYGGNRFIEDFSAETGARVLNTAESGDIIVTTDGHTYEIGTEIL
jgi:competence protein ComEC